MMASSLPDIIDHDPSLIDKSAPELAEKLIGRIVESNRAAEARKQKRREKKAKKEAQARDRAAASAPEETPPDG
ncbi:MAG: hypothetical protein AAGN82_25270 [Myxococcota bacterium]